MTLARWQVPRESDHVWLGPVAVTTTVDGQPVTGATIQLALIRDDRRPVDADWQAPDPDPEGLGRLGIELAAVTASATYGLWVRVIDGPSTYVIEPGDVGWLDRN